MFWGMTLEPGKLYTETMGEEVQLSMAAIDSRKDPGEDHGTNFCQIVIQTEKGEYVLCTLVHGIMFQQSLDLKLMPREKVTFSVQGPSVVSLVGYTASYPEDEEDEEMRMQQGDYEEEESSAWDTFEEGEQAEIHVKEEPVEILDDSDTEDMDKANLQEQISVSAQEQIPVGPQEQEEGTTTESTKEQPEEEETIFSVAAMDPIVKPEPADPGAGPSDISGLLDPSQHPPSDNLYGMQSTDQGLGIPETTTSQDFFYQDAQQQQQQQSDVTLTPPVAFQPITSGPEYQNAPQTTALPPTDTFLQTQAPLIQPSQAGPLRHSSPRGNLSANPQRTYPSPRRQYGANRLKSPGRGRPRGSQSRSVQLRQPRQPVGPGAPPQQGVPGPSTSGMMMMMTPLQGQLLLNQNTSQGLGNQSKQRQTRRGVTFLSSRRNVPPSGANEPFPDTPQRFVGFLCRYCSKAFSTKGAVSRHERIHTGIKPFICNVCNKAFSLKSNLQVHKRTHTGERPFVCRVCSKSFGVKCNLQRHELTHASQ